MPSNTRQRRSPMNVGQYLRSILRKGDFNSVLRFLQPNKRRSRAFADLWNVKNPMVVVFAGRPAVSLARHPFDAGNIRSPFAAINITI